MMNKEGHLGVVRNTSVPIVKDDGETTTIHDEDTLSRNSPMKHGSYGPSPAKAYQYPPGGTILVHHHHHHHHHHSPSQQTMQRPPEMMAYESPQRESPMSGISRGSQNRSRFQEISAAKTLKNSNASLFDF